MDEETWLYWSKEILKETFASGLDAKKMKQKHSSMPWTRGDFKQKNKKRKRKKER